MTQRQRIPPPGGVKLSCPFRYNPARDGFITAVVILVAACIPLVYLRNQAIESLDSEMRFSLQEIAASAALLVDGERHGRFLAPEQEEDAVYQSEVARLRRFLTKSPRMVSLRTLVMRDGRIHFVLDAAVPGDADRDGIEDHVAIMQEIPDPDRAVLAALRDGESAVEAGVVFEGGRHVLRAYAPFRNRDGQVSGAVAVSMAVDEIVNRMKDIGHAALLGGGFAVLLATGVGAAVWRAGRRALAAQRESWEAMEARTLAESRYHHLFDQAPIGVFHFGSDLRITLGNRRTAEILGTYPEAVSGISLGDLRDQRLLPALQQALAGETGAYAGAFRPPGSERDLWIELLSGPVRDASGRVAGGIATIDDVTIRHRIELMSETERELLAMITGGKPLQAILERLVLDIERLMPGSMCSILFLSQDGRHLARGVAPSLPDAYTNQIDGLPIGPRVGSCGTAMYEDRMVITPDIESDPLWNDYRSVAAEFGLRSCWSKPIHSSRGEVMGTFAIYHHEVFVPTATEIALLERAGYIAGIAIERSRHAAELSRERHLLRTLIENMSDVIFIKDRRHRYLAANTAAVRFLGVDSESVLLGKTDFELFPKTTAAASHRMEAQVLAGSPDINQESTIINDAGETTILSFNRMPMRDAAGGMIGLIVIGRNVTDQHHVEEERIKTQKLESLGLLAGGIAHDFNNILTSILGNISMIKQQPEPSAAERVELITEAEQAVMRARELTQQLLTFAKGGMPVKRAADAGKVVAEAARFAVRGSASRIELDIPSGLWIADIDSGQISQVVQNLVLNADQSMPSGGTIGIAARNIELGPGNRYTLPAGPYVSFAVKDAGVGIPERNLGKIFDPYFSTKSTGNGLGLTTSFSIIKKHGGNLVVHSVVDRGSEFTFLLPALPGRKLVETGVTIPPTAARNARILVMDDEDAILKITSLMLERSGYQIQGARHGEEALALFREAMDQGRPFDLVILDLTIPGGMGGKEAFDRLKELDPGVRAIVSSGYSMDEIMSRHEMFGFVGVITKPYHREDLVNAVNQALGGGAPS